MRKSGFWVAYFLLLVAQILLSNYFLFTPYITLSILPVMVLCISTRIAPYVCMLIAFGSGLMVDWLSEGVLGLNAFALVPVALLRNPVIHLVYGEGLFTRKEDFTVKGHGVRQGGLALLMVQAVFLVIYIWADGAGIRPLLVQRRPLLAHPAGRHAGVAPDPECPGRRPAPMTDNGVISACSLAWEQPSCCCWAPFFLSNSWTTATSRTQTATPPSMRPSTPPAAPSMTATGLYWWATRWPTTSW